MLKWHPLTKLLVASATLALPYLAWTLPETEPVATATRDSGLPAAVAAARPALVVPALPALQTFAATVQRPLFSPSRRLIKPAQAELPTASAPPADTGPAGPSEPALRFFGTMGHAGATVAIVAVGGEPKARKLAVGDTVDDWQVIAVGRDHLVIGQGDEHRDYTIFADRQANAGAAGEQNAVTPNAGGDGSDAAPDAAPADDAQGSQPAKDEGEGQ